jgi:hypothetical protein
MKPEDLEAARQIAEHFRAAPKESPVYGISRFLDALIKRGDDYKEALQNMWDVVAICEPNTLGDRVFRTIVQQRAFLEMTKQRDTAVKALREVQHDLIDLNTRAMGLERNVTLANVIAGVTRALVEIDEMDQLLRPIPPEKQE